MPAVSVRLCVAVDLFEHVPVVGDVSRTDQALGAPSSVSVAAVVVTLLAVRPMAVKLSAAASSFAVAHPLALYAL